MKNNAAGEPYWNHEDVFVVRYKDMATSFEKTMRSILAFIGEEYEPEMANFHTVQRLNYSNKIEKPPFSHGEYLKQYRNWQINQPLFDGREKFKKNATDDEVALVNDLAGEMLSRYGY